MRGVLVFDLDGVLVDVSASYRETIIRTIEHFTGRAVSRDYIQEIKNRGGLNDDWALCRRVIRDFGFRPPYAEVVAHFQSVFLGKNNDGLILQELWTPRQGLLEQLSQQYYLAIFTGRTRDEARLTLGRFAPEIAFEPVIGNKDVARPKPAPDGLLKIRQAFPGEAAVYVGDNIDDGRSARAAGVPFIGVAGGDNPRRAELAELFLAEGARSVIENVNELEGALA